MTTKLVDDYVNFIMDSMSQQIKEETKQIKEQNNQLKKEVERLRKENEALRSLTPEKLSVIVKKSMGEDTP